jgi:hypothetical protein
VNKVLNSRAAGGSSREQVLNSRATGGRDREQGLNSRATGGSSREQVLNSRATGRRSRSTGGSSRSTGDSSRSTGSFARSAERRNGEEGPYDSAAGSSSRSTGRRNSLCFQQFRLDDPRLQEWDLLLDQNHAKVKPSVELVDFSQVSWNLPRQAAGTGPRATTRRPWQIPRNLRKKHTFHPSVPNLKLLD